MSTAALLAVVFAVQHVTAVTRALVRSDDVTTDVFAAAVVLRTFVTIRVEDSAETFSLDGSIGVKLDA